MRWALAFVVVGVLARTLRWLLEFPFWGDESNLALNFLTRGLGDLLRPLDHAQVAPVAFVAGEIVLYRTFGAGEQALRALPWIASIASIVCFWRFARVVQDLCPTLPRLAATFGLAIFAVSHYLVRYGSELKPYSCDLLVATLLLWLAAAWLRATERGEPRADRWLWLLALLVAPSLLISYPAILIAGAVGLALVPRVLRMRSTHTAAPLAAYGAATALGFAFSYFVVGRAQRAGASLGVDYLEAFWSKAFPPGEPLALMRWLLETHTGMLFAYPNGGKRGGSVATVLLFAVGVWALLRRAETSPREQRVQREVLALLLLPFALGLLAAALRLYPYGGHLRLTLYLAPSICLLAGAGLSFALAHLPRPEWRVPAARWALVALLLAGVGDMVADLVQPFRDERHAGMRAALHDAVVRARPEDQVVSLHSLEEIRTSNSLGSNFEWYLRTQSPLDVRWGGAVDESALRDGARAYVVSHAAGTGEQDPPPLAAWLAAHAGRLHVVGRHARCLESDCRDALVVVELAATRQQASGPRPAEHGSDGAGGAR